MSIWAIERSRGDAALGGGWLSCVLARLAGLVTHPFAHISRGWIENSATSPRDSEYILSDARSTLTRGANDHSAYGAQWLAAAFRKNPAMIRQKQFCRWMTVVVLTALFWPLPTEAQSGGSWQALGPVGVISQNYGLVTGRITALALDPSDTTGNTLFVGTTGGGVWRSQNAGTSNPSNITFTPLTDDLPAMSGASDASISIGALSVQPGGTGVVLAGTGDPNDALDSYYGAGILRSADGGKTWSLIPRTADQHIQFFWGERGGLCLEHGESAAWWWRRFRRRMKGTLVNAVGQGTSYEGLYYSSDGGASWYAGDDHRRRRERSAGAGRRLLIRMGMRRPRWFGIRYGSCLSRRCATTATTSRRTGLRGRGWRRSPGRDCWRARIFARRYGRYRIDGLPDLSRDSGGESRDRRHLCLDGGCVQPGSGDLAGPVRGRARVPARI